MKPFSKIRARAAERKGGDAALMKLINETHWGAGLSEGELRKIPDDRWLAGMTKAVFRAGFNWKVIEAKWDGFEDAFKGFDVAHCAFLSPEDLDTLTSDTRIVRHGAKIKSVQENAQFLLDRKEEHGSAGAYFTSFGQDNFIDLLADLKKRGTRLGGNSAQYFLRETGLPSFILSQDVVKVLIETGVVDKAPTSKKAMAQVQLAFNNWREESGLNLSQISRIIANSVEA